MATTTLHIKDEVNVRFKGLDIDTTEKIKKKLTFHVPGFIHMPAYRLGGWKGTVSLATDSGKTFFNLLDVCFDILEQENYSIHIEDDRYEFDIHPSIVDETYLSEYLNKDGEPLILRDYQIEGINRTIKNNGGILEMSTGSGKTFICAVLSKVYSQHGKVIVIVPTIDLAVQTFDEFRHVGVQVGIFYGKKKNNDQVTISTWQSLEHYPELFEGVVAVIVDEAHRAKGKVLSKILTGPGASVPIRIGCTGTLPKEELFRYQIRASIGETIFILRTWELQEKGVLADSNVIQIIMKDSKNELYMKARKNFEDWKDEVDWMCADPKRMEWIAEFIKEISTNDGNTLVLVHYIKFGENLAKLIEGVNFIDGTVLGEERKIEYDKFKSGNDNILIATSGIASTGLDIPRIHNMVVIEIGRKFEKIMQTLGRGVRKAKDKSSMMLYDINSDMGISFKHMKNKKKLYKEAKQKIDAIEIEYV